MLRSMLIVAAAAVVVAAMLLAANVAGTSGGSGLPSPANSWGGVLAQAVPYQPQDGSAAPRNGIFVTGEGSITMKPDLAKITLGVDVTNPSAAGAQQDAASKMDAVMSQLKKAGIAEKDVQTVQFNLSPDYDNSTRTPVLKGYRVTNLVVVTVRDISKVGSVLDAVVASGATRLQGITFDVSDPTAAGTQGREEAMKNAKTKADQLAKLAGVTLGPPVSIDETASPPPAPVPMQQMAAPSAAGAPPQTPISAGTQEIHTVVRVVYGIK